MKREEKEKARSLRRHGLSVNEITRTLGVAKGSVSIWVRDIELTSQQKNRISENGRSVESVERRRYARLANEEARRKVYFDKAVDEIYKVSEENLLFTGCALYWGEGSKTKRNRVNFTNSDPRSIQVMMRFFREVCNVPEDKLHAHICLHPHLDAYEAEQYWSCVSGIPIRQFYKTSMQHNKASKNKKDSIPMGTLSININDTTLYLRIMGWIEGIYSKVIPKTDYITCRFHQFL